jgi:hypothetical protein
MRKIDRSSGNAHAHAVSDDAVMHAAMVLHAAQSQRRGNQEDVIINVGEGPAI